MPTPFESLPSGLTNILKVNGHWDGVNHVDTDPPSDVPAVDPAPPVTEPIASPSVPVTEPAVKTPSPKPVTPLPTVEPVKESLKADNPAEGRELNPEVAAAIYIAKTAILENVPEALRGLAKDKSLQELSAWVDSSEYKTAKEALLSVSKPADPPNPDPPKVDVPPDNDNPPPAPKTFRELTDAHYAEFAKAII